MNTPTAQEFLKAYATWSTQDSPDTMTTVIDISDCLEAMIEFAKLHVEAALEAAALEAHTKLVPFTDNEQQVDKESILTAYPLTNIK